MPTHSVSVVAVALGVVLSGCGEEPSGLGDVVQSIEVTPSTVTFDALGDLVTLNAVARNEIGQSVTGVLFTWTSSDNDVATVDQLGVVMSVGNGMGEVTVQVSPNSPVGQGTDARATASIAVTQVPSSILLDAPVPLIHEGDTVRLSVEVADANGNPISGTTVDPSTLTWTTSDPAIAQVDPSGLVTGVAMGPVRVGASLPASASDLFLATSVQESKDSLEIDVLVTFTALEIGAFHSCGITEFERAYCWGSNGEGRLGSISPSDSAPSNRHVPVRGDRAYRSVSAGDSHTCAIDADGLGYCWGKNDWGQLGTGSANAVGNTDPMLVAGGLAFSRFDIGWRNTCGITEGGDLFCWGLGTSGRLGTGDTSATFVPTAAATPVTFVGLTLGEHHGCAIAVDELLYCWGDNSLGQLGVTTGEMCVDIFGNTTDCATTPTVVSASLRFQSVSAGRSHTCGVTIDEVAYCWGDGTDGRLGIGSTDSTTVPTPVAGGLSFTVVSAGIAHTCGVTTNSSVYCWGSNIVGQIGDGTLIDRAMPVEVTLPGSAAAVTSGASHTCALTTDNVAYCWGFNLSGQLGDGMNVSSPTPVLVLGQQ